MPLTLGADNYRGCPGSCCKSPGSERAACDRSRSPLPTSPLLGGLDMKGIWGWEGAESHGEPPPGGFKLCFKELLVQNPGLGDGSRHTGKAQPSGDGV